METVKIVFDVDSKDIKSTTDELKALNKVTNEEVAAMQKLSNSASDAGDGFVSLRTRVKEAKEEAVKAAEKYGEFSTQALDAKKKAGALADQMGDLNRQVNLLNPEAKAKAFSNLAQGVVGAFSVATGALQAFGVKNKEVEQLAMQLQGALNITQGIASLGQLKEAYQDVKVVLGFTTVAQEAMTVANTAEAASATAAATATAGFGTALAATGIGAIVIAIGVLVGGMIALGNATETDEQKQKELEDQLKLTNEQLEYQANIANMLSEATARDTNLAIIRAKIRGASEKELSDITAKGYEKQKQLLEQNVKDQKKAWDDYVAGSHLKTEEAAKFEKRYYDATKALQDLNYNNQVTVLNNELSLQQKRDQEREKDIAKRKQDLKDQEQEAIKLLKLQDDLRKKLQENRLAEISDPQQRIQQERQFANEEYAIQLARLQNAGATQEEIDLLAANHSALIFKLNQQEKDNQEKTQKERLASYKSFIDQMNGIVKQAETDPIKKIQQENDAIDKAYADQYALAKANNEDTTALDEAYLAAVKVQQEKMTQATEDEAKKRTDITKKEQADKLALQREYGNGIVDSLQFITDSLVQGDQAAREEELASLEDQKNKKIISEEEYQKRLKVIKQKQAEDAKRAAIYNATLDLSRAIIAALTIPPPGSVIAANFAAALAGANLLRIIATPIPKFQKGTLAVPGVDMGRDSVHAMLQPGEAVIPVSTNRAYHPTIKAIYEKKISPSEINSFVMSRTSSGGRQSITANVDSFALGRVLSKNKGVQIENAQVVGKVIASELNNYNVRRGW